MLSRPDVLVLGGGGVLGEAWLTGVLAGIEDATGFDLRRCEYFIGTSAGSIVSANLVAGSSPRRPTSTGTELERTGAPASQSLATAGQTALRRAGAWALAAGSAFAPLALGVSTPGGAALRAALLRGLPRPRDTLDQLHERIASAGARFDGRLRVATVDRRNGRRVMFGSPGAPSATVADAVVASCSVPWLFSPVEISGREYVDGGVWSPSNLDTAPVGLDTHVLCLNPTGSIAGSNNLIALVRNVARSAVSLEAMVLRRRGAVVQTVSPNIDSAAAMGTNFMDYEPRSRVLSAGYAQGMEIGRSGVAE